MHCGGGGGAAVVQYYIYYLLAHGNDRHCVFNLDSLGNWCIVAKLYFILWRRFLTYNNCPANIVCALIFKYNPEVLLQGDAQKDMFVGAPAACSLLFFSACLFLSKFAVLCYSCIWDVLRSPLYPYPFRITVCRPFLKPSPMPNLWLFFSEVYFF